MGASKGAPVPLGVRSVNPVQPAAPFDSVAVGFQSRP
jgi:hypothetical protein